MDRLDFSIDGVRKTIEELILNNQKNEKNKAAFVEYIDSSLAPEWNTKEGKIAVEELKKFANTEYQDYIQYLEGRINVLENTVVPALENINNA